MALQAFANEIDQFPKAWSPLSLVAPLTEFSAEYQAICYALNEPEVEIVFVDRSVDHVFQWMPQEEEELEKQVEEQEKTAEESQDHRKPTGRRKELMK